MDAHHQIKPHASHAAPAHGLCAVRRILAILGQCSLLSVLLFVAMGAQQRSTNFIIETPDPAFAQQVAQTAERCRHDLAIAWTGAAMPNWSRPCIMRVQVGQHLGAGGATTFVFDRGEVFNWQMTIQGSRERILDSVLPHEITHMVFASHFRQPLPRWADEGGATSVEHSSERGKQYQMLNQFLRTGRGIAFSQMFAMTEYPSDIMPLYAQGYSLADFLIQTGGRRKYVEFLGDGLQSNDWPSAIRRNYGLQDLGVLQNTWLAWVKQGSPQLAPRSPEPAAPVAALASNEPRRPLPEPNLLYHVHDKQQPGKPLAAMVPVHLASSTPSVEVKPVRTASASLRWVNPARKDVPKADRIAVVDPREAEAASKKSANPSENLPHPVSEEPSAGKAAVAGWRNSNGPTAGGPWTTQVSRPQPWETPRQTILR